MDSYGRREFFSDVICLGSKGGGTKAMNKEELRETRKQMLPLVTTFSPRDSLSKLSSPLGLPKEFAKMEQCL